MELIVSAERDPLDEEREEWTRLALQCLVRAYCDDEPDYPLDAIQEMNPEYERN